jgi:hypothetical protein
MSISLVPSMEFDQFDIDIQDEWSEYKSLYGVLFTFAEPIIVDCYL